MREVPVDATFLGPFMEGDRLVHHSSHGQPPVRYLWRVLMQVR